MKLKSFFLGVGLIISNSLIAAGNGEPSAPPPQYVTGTQELIRARQPLSKVESVGVGDIKGVKVNHHQTDKADRRWYCCVLQLFQAAQESYEKTK